MRTSVNKGIMYDSPNHTLPVEVRFSHLEGTLLPFGNVGHHCEGKAIGTIPLGVEMDGHQPINQDDRLMGYTCYLTKSNMRYFVHEKQKYYRLGDLLSLRNIVDAMAFCGETCNFVYYWAILCKHMNALQLFRKKEGRGGHGKENQEFEE